MSDRWIKLDGISIKFGPSGLATAVRGSIGARKKKREFLWEHDTGPNGKIRIFLTCFKCGAINDITGHSINEEGTPYSCVVCPKCINSSHITLEGWPDFLKEVGKEPDAFDRGDDTPEEEYDDYYSDDDRDEG